MTASVSVELQAPIMTGTLSLHDQLLGRRHRLGRIGLVVLDDELDLLAQHAAGGVDLVLGDLGALRHVIARSGESARQRLRYADADGILRKGRAREQRRANEAGNYGCPECTVHQILPNGYAAGETGASMISEYILASNRTFRYRGRGHSFSLEIAFRHARFLLVDSRTDMLAVGPLLSGLTLNPLEKRRAGN